MRGARISSASLAHGLPAAGLVLALFTYWFAYANRYEVFLYEHLGATPFHAVTRSRYLMAGLVAAGAVLIAYAAVTWLLGRLAHQREPSYHPPPWWRVWLAAAPWVVIGVPAITLTMNAPTLPAWLALGCAGVTLFGLALAFMPGEWAATRPVDLAWLVFDGAGLTPVLLLLIVLGLPARALLSPAIVYGVAFGALAASLIWLGVMSVFRAFLDRPLDDWRPLLMAGLCLSYLVLPLVHYLTASPGLHYMTAATNFFTASWAIQVAIWALAALLAYGATSLRRHVSHPQPKP